MTALENHSVASYKTGSDHMLILSEKLPDRMSIQRGDEILNFSFKFHKYARHRVEGVGNLPQFLKSDEILRLWHPEARAYLTASTTPSENKCWLHKSNTTKPDCLRALGRANSLWQLEECTLIGGHVVQWDGFYRLRHTISMKYLAVSYSSYKKEGKQLTYWPAELVDLTADGSEGVALMELAKRTMFQLVNTETQDEFFVDREDSGVRFRHVLPDDLRSNENSEQECWLHFSDSGTKYGSEELALVFRDISGAFGC
jgi:hypothetical protein